MARFNVHLRRNGPGYLLDCQADILSRLATRFVVPLLPIHNSPQPAGRLNPVFEIGDQPHVMVTQFATAVPMRDMGERVASLAHEDTRIISALDMLITGV
jgi:toxin CcdB